VVIELCKLEAADEDVLKHSLKERNAELHFNGESVFLHVARGLSAAHASTTVPPNAVVTKLIKAKYKFQSHCLELTIECRTPAPGHPGWRSKPYLVRLTCNTQAAERTGSSASGGGLLNENTNEDEINIRKVLGL
jgi:hypothetical protein